MRNNLQRLGRWTLCVVAAIALTGCGSTPQTSSLNQALASYNAHHYNTAHSHAVAAMRTASGRERDQAAYIAGLCAYLLNNLDEAELRLSAATRSSDARTAGSAKAMLGQVRLDQNRPNEAAALFEAAAKDLTGSDAAEARRFAAIAHQYAGNQPAVDQWTASQAYTPSSHAGGTFTLQVGAFNDRQRASQAATDAARLAEGSGLGPVNIIDSRDSRGRALYLVQFGSFASRNSAAQTRAQLGRLDFIVAPRATR